MEYEIELKLLTNEQAGDVIETKLLPQVDASVTQDTLVLTNHYFDTPDRLLRQYDIGLRVRGNNNKYEQTLKTSGKSISGLHQRPEYNVQLNKLKKQSIIVPNLRLFPLTAWPETIDVDILQTKIEILFTTHFERKSYVFEFSNGDIVELVWDLGEVTSGDKSVPICEIELELKKGTTPVLFNLARRIVSLVPTSIGTDSKAARGYKLLDDLPVKEIEQYQQDPPDNTQTEVEVFSSLLTTQLQNFQMLAAEAKHQYSERLAININRILSALIDNVAGFSHYSRCLPLEHIHIELKKLAQDWTSVVQQQDEKAANRLLVRGQTTQLQLDIVQCLVEQPWSSSI